MKVVDIIKTKNGLNFLAHYQKNTGNTLRYSSRMSQNIYSYDPNKKYPDVEFSWKKYVRKFPKAIYPTLSGRFEAISNNKMALKLRTYRYEFDGDFLDLEDEDVTFTPYNVEHHANNHAIALNKGRQKIGLQKFLMKVLKDSGYSEEEIKKASDEMIAYGKDFSVTFLEGTDVSDTYSNFHYSGSCMRGKPTDWFEIYADNPKTCKLGLILDGQKQPLARFLYWLNSIDDEWYADTLYAKDNIVRTWFLSWVKKENVNQVSGGHITKKGNQTYEEISVNLVRDVRDYDYLPYVDSVRYTDGDNVLSNQSGEYCLDGQYGHELTCIGDERYDEDDEDDD